MSFLNPDEARPLSVAEDRAYGGGKEEPVLYLYTWVQSARAQLRRDEGATMVEYGLMIALIAAVCVGIVLTLGETLEGKFSDVEGTIP
jgi:pilus assembly protein Flp/PilA